MDKPGESDHLTQKAGDTDDPNDESSASVRTEYCETSDLFSEESFDGQASPYIDNRTTNWPADGTVCESSERTRGEEKSSGLDLLFVTPIRTPKFFNEDSRSTSRAVVPKVPTSLVPFISTVNESWTSELETPNAQTAASHGAPGYSINGESNERPKSHESLLRNGRESTRSYAVLHDAATPNGCFAARMEDENFSTSPILRTVIKKHRPKRRILKSLDANVSTTSLAKKFQAKPDEDIDDFETKNKSQTRNSTNDCSTAGDQGVSHPIIFSDENSSLLDNGIPIECDDAIVLSQKIDEQAVEDPLAVNNDLFSSFIVNPERDKSKTVLTDVSNWCDDNTDERTNETNGKSFGERLKEMKKLRKNRPQFREDKYVRVPSGFFTEEAEALESAAISPFVSTVNKCRKSDGKNRWGGGLMSFTRMCLLERNSEKREPSGQTVDDSNKDPEIRLSNDPEIERNDLREGSSTEPVEEDEGDIANIFASSFIDKEEPAIDIHEFSPWFYQSDEIKSNSFESKAVGGRSSLEVNIGKAKGGLGATNRQEKLAKILPEASGGGNLREDKENEDFVHEITSYASIGFSTACGKPIEVSEDKMRRARRLYEEIAAQDGNNRDFESPDEIEAGPMDCRKDENGKGEKTIGRVAIAENSYVTTGFSTAGGEPIKISEDKLKRAEKLYAELSAEIGDKFAENSSSSSLIDVRSPRVPTARGVKRKCEAHRTCEQLDSAWVDFATARGQPLRVSETAMKRAKLTFDNDGEDFYRGIERSKGSSGSKNEPKATRLAAEPESADSQSGNVFSGFTTAGGRSLSISKCALQRAELMYRDVSHDALDAEDRGRVSARGEKKNSDRESSSDPSEAFVRDVGSVGKRDPSPTGQISTGFSTANGVAIRVSGAAIAKAKMLLAEEGIDRDLESPGDATGVEDKSVGFSLASERGNEQQLAIEQESSLAKRSVVSQAIKTSTKSNSSVFTTSGFVSPFENVDARCSVFRKSKEPRPSSVRGRDMDEEGVKVVKSNDEKSESTDCRVQRTGRGNDASAMYANSEMFPTVTDRPVIPRLEPQRSSPSMIRNLFLRELRLSGARNEDPAAFYDEVAASTEALLADEENSNDGELWASAMTCGPSMTEERGISVRPVILGEDGDAIVEAPPSPIMGEKFRFRRKKKRRNGKSVTMRNASAVDAETNGRTDGKDVIDRRTADLPDSQRSDATSSASGSSKGLRRSGSPQETREAIANLLENRIAATLEQEKMIRAKKKLKPRPVPGSLYLCKTGRKESRVSLRDLTNGIPPAARTPQELIDLGVGSDALEITAANAARYRLKCAEFRSSNGEEIRTDACQLDVGDGGRLILDEDGAAGAEEFERAFIASPNVDPNLVPRGWVENHYRWIVWKLASMDRMKLGGNRMLTPDRIMKQLKYRYDREVDRSERSALRRIVEKDDPACRRMILCVASIAEISDDQSPESKSLNASTTTRWKVLLTDGWYGIAASLDPAMEHFISSGKVREGTKLVTCGAELLNCDQGFSPLEMPAEVSLKIHCNSTRRARWDAKLGYCRNAGPIPTRISAVLPYGGLIGKLDTVVARLYPIQYCEKTEGGQTVFRNDKCEDKAAMIYEEKRQARIDAIYSKARADFESRNWEEGSETSDIESFRKEVESVLQKSLPPPRKVTPVLKARVIDGGNIASLTIWAPSEDAIEFLKEGHRVSVHNLQSSGRRLGELNLTAGRQSFVKYGGSSAHDYPRRRLTQLNEVAATGFDPIFGDFDTVGVVVSSGPAPRGMKNFEAVNLAFPNADSSSSAYLTILFWEGVAAYGFAEILTVGSTVACTNLQWRRGPPRTIPIAYSTEYSTFTRNPRQVYLRSAFDRINDQITDLPSYMAQCAAEITAENERRTIGTRSPAIHGSPGKTSSPYSPVPVNELSTEAAGANRRTPQGGAMNTGEIITPARYSIRRRLEKLQWYGEPPDLSPITINHDSIKVKQKFVSPLRTPEKRN